MDECNATAPAGHATVTQRIDRHTLNQQRRAQ
jgi:hypothetical protein